MWSLVEMCILNMELFWLWMPVLGSLMLAEILWTLPINQDQWPRPEDVELAEVCGWTTSFIWQIRVYPSIGFCFILNTIYSLQPNYFEGGSNWLTEPPTSADFKENMLSSNLCLLYTCVNLRIWSHQRWTRTTNALYFKWWINLNITRWTDKH